MNTFIPPTWRAIVFGQLVWDFESDTLSWTPNPVVYGPFSKLRTDESWD